VAGFFRPYSIRGYYKKFYYVSDAYQEKKTEDQNFFQWTKAFGRWGYIGVV
jgi:hypothetical protein